MAAFIQSQVVKTYAFNFVTSLVRLSQNVRPLLSARFKEQNGWIIIN